MRPAQPILGKEKDVDSGKTELPQVSESPVCLPIHILPFFFFVEMNTSIRNALQREAAVEVTGVKNISFLAHTHTHTHKHTHRIP